jgi:hypothetical protein
MRNIAIVGILFVFLFVGCQSESRVEETQIEQTETSIAGDAAFDTPMATDPAMTAEGTPEAMTDVTGDATPTTTVAAALPKTHNIDKGGSMHAPGMETPNQKCAACHGKDLKGGKTAPSCYACHEQNWKA